MSDRSVTSGDISQSAVVTGSGNVVSLVFGSTGLVLPVQRKQIPPPERRRRQEKGERPRELDILNPEIGRLPLIGREALLDELEAWLKADVDISVHALTGRAGSGKTRLAMELCARVDGAPEVGAWLAGFLSPTELASVVDTLAAHEFTWERPTLLVVDYAGQVQAALARWLDRLARQKLTNKLRILLLEREAPMGFGWWHELVGSTLNTAAGRRELFWDATLRPFEFPGLEGLEERRQVVAAALEAAEALRGEPAGVSAIPAAGTDTQFDDALSAPGFGNPLNLVMVGVLALDQGPRAALALRSLDAARRLGRRELERFGGLAGGNRAITHIVAFNGLAGGLSIEGLNVTLANELATAGLAADAGALATLLQQELPPPIREGAAVESRLGTVQPDLIGEGMIVEAFTGEPAVEAGAADTVERAYHVGRSRAAESLMRLLQDYAYALEDRSATGEERDTARRLMAWLDHLQASIDSPEDLEPLAVALPWRTTILREAALELAERLARASLQAFELSRNPAHAARAAGWLQNVSKRLSDLGRRGAALAAVDEAVMIYRKLAEERSDAFTADLATALDTLASCLSDVGRREQALAVAEEAVAFYRTLVEAYRDAFTPDLARSLSNLANRLSALGQREQALAAVEEAAVFYRALAEARPHAFTPERAFCLNNLARVLSDLGQRERALAAADEALALYRALAHAQPDAFAPDLATFLSNHANFLADLGLREQGLAAAEEAVMLGRALAETRPDAFTPDLARSLNNLAKALSELGLREQALAAAGEAVAVRRALADAEPDAFTSNLATSLDNLGGFLSDVGHREQALAAAQEALTLRRALAEAEPDAFTPHLATSLNNVANFLSDVGQWEEALTTAEEAVALYRALAKALPDAFTGDLAMALNNLARLFSNLDGREQALAAAEESVALYRSLAESRPGVFAVDLATSLGTLANVRRAGGDLIAAREANTEGVLLLKPLFLEAPRAVVQWMAMHLQAYLQLSRELGQERDMQLIGPVLEMFRRMKKEGGGDGE